MSEVVVLKENSASEDRGLRKTRVGIVVSNKMQKTIVVKVERKVKHPLFGKYIKLTKKFMADDAQNECNIGDKVRIMETRPLSKRKNWRLVEIIEKKK
jgi:small subunit ribosomal protein S17